MMSTSKGERHVSHGGRVFYTEIERPNVHNRSPDGETWIILYEGALAGRLYRDDMYGRTSIGALTSHASTRGLYWRYASDAPIGIGFDVSGCDSVEEAMAAWLRKADEILDWSEGIPVSSIYSRTGVTQRSRGNTNVPFFGGPW